MQCPACKAENAEEHRCRRCKADLSLLFQIEDQRSWALATARRCLIDNDLVEAGRLAVHADWLRNDEESTRLIAVVALLSRDFERAFRCHQMLRGSLAVAQLD